MTLFTAIQILALIHSLTFQSFESISDNIIEGLNNSIFLGLTFILHVMKVESNWTESLEVTCLIILTSNSILVGIIILIDNIVKGYAIFKKWRSQKKQVH